MNVRAFGRLALLLALVAVAGCDDDGDSDEAVRGGPGEGTCEQVQPCEGVLVCMVDTDNACDGVTCSGQGVCAIAAEVAICVCDPGFHAEGLECVQDAVDPCDGVSCSDLGICAVAAGLVMCACDDGYHAEGLDCVKDAVVDPCDGVSCSDQGICAVADGLVLCACDDGYHAEGLDCIPDGG